MNNPNAHNRFLMELDLARREINRKVLSPNIQSIGVEEMKPTMRAVAHARAAYITAFMSVADSANPEPTPEMIATLKQRREAFDELRLAANALELVIQRDYIDVKATSRKDN